MGDDASSLSKLISELVGLKLKERLQYDEASAGSSPLVAASLHKDSARATAVTKLNLDEVTSQSNRKSTCHKSKKSNQNHNTAHNNATQQQAAQMAHWQAAQMTHWRAIQMQAAQVAQWQAAQLQASR